MAPKSIATLPLLLLGTLLLVHCQTPPTGAQGQAAIIAAAAKYGLVDVRTAVPGVVVDLPYATSRNCAGRPLYPADMPCLIERRTGQQLAEAQREVAKHGYRIKIWDAYRSPAIPPRLVESRAQRKLCVGSFGVPLRPLHRSGHRHDLGGLRGSRLKMPTGFDHFFPRPPPNTPVVIPRSPPIWLCCSRRCAGLASVTMKTEWWHFFNPQVTPFVSVPSDRLGIVLPFHVRSIPLRSK